MKRFSVGLFVSLLIGLLMTTTTIAFADTPIKLIVNGKEIYSDVPPQIIDGRIMVPVRFVAESLGAGVIWDRDLNSVNIDSNDSAQKKKELTVDEWRNVLLKTLDTLEDIIKDDSLSRVTKAAKIALLTKDSLSYTIPEAHRLEHYYLMQLLFATRDIFIVQEASKNDSNIIDLAQSKAIIDFNKAVSEDALQELKDSLN